MYKFIKKSTLKRDAKLPNTVIVPFYQIDALPGSDGNYSGWIYLDEQLVEEIRASSRLEVLAACDVWCHSRYTIVEW